MKRILITGGAGFVGSNLCDRLYAQGHHIICLDNFYTGSRHNIEHLIGKERFSLIEHDVNEPMTFDVDEIYHLACPASPYYYQIDPVKTITTNIQGTINVLELARKNGAKVVHASTSEVYGDPLVHPQTEDYRGNVNPLSPRACYDEGKRCAETLCMDYRRQYDVDVRIVRIFNTYGPRMALNDGRVVSNFIVQALQGKPITIFGEGQQTRSFQYVTDLLDGLTRLMEVESFYGPVNVGNPEEFTIKDYAELILKLVNSTSELSFLPLPSDDPKQRKPDISLAKEKLNWEPKIPVEEGMKKTVAYFKEVLQNPEKYSLSIEHTNEALDHHSPRV